MVAQTYAEQCVFDHNNNSVNQQSTFSSVGENIFVTTQSSANYTMVVEAWNNEVADYNYEGNSCTAVCGHYTQVNLS